MILFLLSLLTSHAVASPTLSFLDANGGRWVSEHSCISCHSAWSYALGRIGTPGWEASPIAQTLAYAADRQARWDSVEPWYGTRGSQKGNESFGSEAILEAFIQVEAQRAGAHLDPQPAIAHLLKLQKSDGSFYWLDYHLQPLESENAAIWGAAMARIAIARSGYTPPKDSIAKLDRFLADRFSENATSLYCRLAIAWAASESGTLLSAQQIKDLFQAIESLQYEDGGWSMNDLGPWQKQGSPAGSDANATSFVLLVFNSMKSGSDRMALAATSWLETHMNSDGSWSGVSVNYDSDLNRTLMTDLATGMASRVLTPLRYQR